MSSRKTWFVVKVINEGYCCPNAYLRLCRARNENVRDMAKNINISTDALWYHYRKLDACDDKSPACRHFADCMDAVITEIENEKKPLERGQDPPSKD